MTRDLIKRRILHHRQSLHSSTDSINDMKAHLEVEKRIMCRVSF